MRQVIPVAGASGGDERARQGLGVTNERLSPQPVPELSVVIPFRDEAENVEHLLAEVRAVLKPVCPYEIVCVDDGSQDATPAILRQLARTQPQVRCVRHEASCGQSSAIRTGVAIARAAWIVTLDGDGQNDPVDIPTLLAARDDPSAPAPLGLVTGERRIRRDSWVTRVSARIANAGRRRVLGDETPDTGCGLKLFPRELFLALPYFEHMHRFLPALVRREGGRTISVPVGHRPRLRGRSHYGIWNRLWPGLVDLAGVLWLKRRMHQPVIVSLEPEGGSYEDSLSPVDPGFPRTGAARVALGPLVGAERDPAPQRSAGGAPVPQHREKPDRPLVRRPPS